MKNTKINQMTQLGLLLALEVVLTFTPLGFIMIPPVSVTLLHIPVIIGAFLLGTKGGMFLGTTFGILSIIRATTSGSVGDILFNPFASGNPLGSIVMAVLPRFLLGLFAALIYIALSKRMNGVLAMGISAGISTVIHSFGVLSLMALFFKSFPLKEVFGIILSVNCLLEIVAAVIICTAVCKGVMAAMGKRTKE